MTEKEMKRVKVVEGEAPCLALAQKIAALSAAILAPELDPQVATESRVRAIVGSVRAHPSKETQALAMIEEAEKPILDALRRGDYSALGQLLDRFDQKYRYAGLATPAVEPTPRELYARIFARWGWSGEELDAAIVRIKPGARVKVDWDRFTVGDRTVSRESVRLGLKPRRSSDSDAAWLNRFPQMKRAIVDGGDIVFVGTGSL
ncbi:MAG: hypothetical protein ABSC63_10660 [Candidatus Binataceae bacterium]|jgi:hypothetical protein